jgi:hypothetical protein
MGAGVQEKIDAAGRLVNSLQDLKSRLGDVPSQTITDKALNVLPNKIGQSGLLGGDIEKRAQFNADFQAIANEQLRAMSGLAVTDGEARRHENTMPGATASDESKARWIDRGIALQQAGIARMQARATNKFVVTNPDGSLTDTTTGKVVKGTESPYRVEIKGTKDSLPRAKAAAAPPAAPTGKWKIEPAD